MNLSNAQTEDILLQLWVGPAEEQLRRFVVLRRMQAIEQFDAGWNEGRGSNPGVNFMNSLQACIYKLANTCIFEVTYTCSHF